MTYARLIEFCELITATKAMDVADLADLHVKPDGVISVTLQQVIHAILTQEDFDFRTFLAELVDYIEDLPDRPNKPGRILN